MKKWLEKYHRKNLIFKNARITIIKYYGIFSN
jgi:hypothetical protein